MAEMRVTPTTENLDPVHPVAVIRNCANVIRVDRIYKTGPTGTRIELGSGAEEGQSTTDTGIESGCMIVVKRATERTFRTLATGDFILFRSQKIAPFGVSFYDLLQDICGSGTHSQEADRNEQSAVHEGKMAQSAAPGNPVNFPDRFAQPTGVLCGGSGKTRHPPRSKITLPNIPTTTLPEQRRREPPRD